jgi:hypothetical protein
MGFAPIRESCARKQNKAKQSRDETRAVMNILLRGNMKRLIGTVALVILTSAWAMAQESFQAPRGLGYIYAGPATHQMGLTMGLGGEGFLFKGLGVGAEIGTAGFNTSANGNPNWIGVGSADASYHLFTKKAKGRVSPFVTGGYTLFFGQDTDAGTGSIAHGYNLGGGVDLFASKYLGVRFDVRYYAHGGRILWASFPNDSQLNFAAFRIGFTFR